ncbi:S9 family peptidase [Arcanobacterium hippocoleae]|uniref:Oligopeptidase B n=2 Tax=Arcanobacterium hippocoleae TaxID=149017 RepID=A0ABU1T3W1_9ACTO|nr:prolyl oligopeptidase family serine peptidase [Arcanobacterium hippocoleae]MDR6939525.1 oligopeptidase B [Arcanobacterium hippocoleae]
MAEEIDPNLATKIPMLEKRPITRIFHGDEFVDNYEWLRNASESEVYSHIRAENNYYTTQTAHLEDLRKQLVSEYAAHTQEDDLGVPTLQGDYWYWSETRKGAAYPLLWRLPRTDFPSRPAVGNAAVVKQAQLVYDANLLAAGEEFFAIGSRAISRDGRLCALAIDTSGGETFRLRIHEIASGAVIDDVVVGITYGLIFNADASRIYYLRADDAWRTCELWVHQVGASAMQDVLLWRENDARFEVWIEASRNGDWLVLNTSSRTTSEVYLLDLRVAKAGDIAGVAAKSNVSGEQDREITASYLETRVAQDLHQPAPFSIGGRREGVEYYAELVANGILVSHNLHHPDFEIAVANEVAPFDLTQLPVIFSPQPGERVVELAGFASFAAVQMRVAGMPQIRILRQRQDSLSADLSSESACSDFANTAQICWEMAELIPTRPGETLELGVNAEWDLRSLQFTREALITPLTVSEYDLDSRQLQDLKVTPVPNFSQSDYVEYVEWVTARDGTQIPVTIAHRADLRRDGKNPGYVNGYGSYEITNDVWFNNLLISLLDRGVVVAFTHVRGGGEFGRAWYEHGKLLEKRNTFTDFIDSTRYLVDLGLLDPQRIAAEGRSAGGLLMGAIANLAPELYRVVLAGVPFVDALTTILKPELPLTVGEWEEWGNPLESLEVYEYMRSYSPYENISAVEYPAILAATSINDVRVSFLEPTKWVAALRDQTLNYADAENGTDIARPIFLKTEMVAGHAGGSGRYQRWENRASEYAFILDQLGLS